MYDPKASDGMRGQDVLRFAQVARIQKVYILVRPSNPQSLQWIDRPDFMAKPLDCKPKTADLDANVDGRHVETAGLVVNPETPGLGNVFKGKKLEKARKAWADFVAHVPLAECGPRDGKEVRTWNAVAPGWAVQMCRESPHYGCLMHSTYPRGMNGRYVYGDYDLFGIAPGDDPARIRRLNETVLGRTNGRGPNTQAVQFAVNAMIGRGMVLHGEQELYADFDEDKLLVFFPDARPPATLVNEAQAREFYRTELNGRELFYGPGLPAGHGVWLKPEAEGSLLGVALADIMRRLGGFKG